MADNTTLNAGTGGDVIATDDIGGVKHQRVKIEIGADGSASDVHGGNPLPVTGTVAISGGVSVSGSVTASGTVTADQGAAGVSAWKVDGSGVTQPISGSVTASGTVTANQGTAGVSAWKVDGSGVTQPVSGAVTASGTVTSNQGTAGAAANAWPTKLVDSGGVNVAAVSAANALKVDGSAVTQPVSIAATVTVTGDVADGTADSGNPVKTGGYAIVSALPGAHVQGRRVNNIADRYGRVLTAHIDGGLQVWKSATYATTQTGAALWTPTSGTRIAITHLSVSVGGTTAGRLTVWFGATADTTYNEGTDQAVLDAEFTPTTNGSPGAILQPSTPIYCANTDYVLRVTTSAALNPVHITVYGYEFTP